MKIQLILLKLIKGYGSTVQIRHNTPEKYTITATILFVQNFFFGKNLKRFFYRRRDVYVRLYHQI